MAVQQQMVQGEDDRVDQAVLGDVGDQGGEFVVRHRRQQRGSLMQLPAGDRDR
jgi:hypothetical protein